jgi:1-deoxy-D-xylulose-5-phosphate reductoisomerase
MMNKGLECMEAAHLFSVPIESIDVVVHRQSIIHSMVVFRDGSTLAQLGPPDMRLPIQYALTWPERLPSPVPPPVWTDVSELTFAPPDETNFPAPALARTAFARGGTSPAILSGANEAAVEQFLSNKITLPDITARAASALETLPSADETLENILTADAAARAFIRSL